MITYSFSFQDIKITRHNQQFKTSVYGKPTFSGDLHTMKVIWLNHIRSDSMTIYYFAVFRFALTTSYFIWNFQMKQEMLRVITIAMICSALASL